MYMYLLACEYARELMTTKYAINSVESKHLGGL